MSEREPPTFENAPGVVVRPRARGFAVVWQCRTDIAKAGFTPRSFRILIVKENPSEAERAFVAAQCNYFQDRMIAFSLLQGVIKTVECDGTWGSLVEAYQTDPDSPFQKIRYYSKRNYCQFLKRIKADYGTEVIAEFKGRQMLRWYENWCVSGIPMAHGLVTMLRTLLTFGSTILDREDCKIAKGFMSDMKFAMPKPRKPILTADHANAIRTEAHSRGLHSIALAQAIQFEVMLRQRDVIGEWVPQSEPGLSYVLDDGMKWLRGIRWEEISKDLVLTHVTSKRQKELTVNLKLCPMVMEELDRLGPMLPSNGPVVVYEGTGRPWRADMFRARWRRIARAGGVPEDVRNMDSRAGAITEATAAGADPDHVRITATHTMLNTTMGYSRGQMEKTEQVQRKRIEHRNKSRTTTA